MRELVGTPGHCGKWPLLVRRDVGHYEVRCGSPDCDMKSSYYSYVDQAVEDWKSRIKKQRQDVKEKETLREICEWALALTDDPQLQSNANIGQLRVLCEGQLRRLDKRDEALKEDASC